MLIKCITWVYCALGIALIPFWRLLFWLRMRRQREDKQRLPERWGYAPTDFSKRSQHHPFAWVHAASVGEARAALSLIKALNNTHPALWIVFTTGTRASAQMLARHLPSQVIHQMLPLDIKPYITRFLRTWKPRAAFFLEAELWPLTLSLLEAQNIPTYLVNGRLSRQSFKRWWFCRGLAHPLFQGLEGVYTPSLQQKQQFESLGGRQVHICPNLKWANPLSAPDSEAYAILSNLLKGKKVWVAASVRSLEEDIILQTYRKLHKHIPNLVLILVPRHLARLEPLQEKLQGAGVALYHLFQQSLNAPLSVPEVL